MATVRPKAASTCLGSRKAENNSLAGSTSDNNNKGNSTTPRTLLARWPLAKYAHFITSNGAGTWQEKSTENLETPDMWILITRVCKPKTQFSVFIQVLFFFFFKIFASLFLYVTHFVFSILSHHSATLHLLLFLYFGRNSTSRLFMEICCLNAVLFPTFVMRNGVAFVGVPTCFFSSETMYLIRINERWWGKYRFLSF